jgi:ferredoxin
VHVRVAQRRGGHRLDSFDLLRAPVAGAFLRWRHARTTLQSLLLATAILLVLHGLFGNQDAPANLATVLSWVHYRGLLVLTLLAAGNFFCTGCPIVLVRNLGRRLHAPSRRWPRALRGKWIALALFAGVLFAYELFDLWSAPAATAWLVVGYFAVALAVDLVFSGASFCQYVCPIGQFNFTASMLSPLEIQIREPQTCATCRTADCVRGRHDAAVPVRLVQRGCELGLFLPSKVGNVDCTFCLECVHACPHDNVALAARVPGAELLETGRRSGIGRLLQRPDIAAFVVAFAFAGLVNAFAMTDPAHMVEMWLMHVMHVTTEAPVLAALFVIMLVVAPIVLLGGATTLTPGWRRTGWLRTAIAYAYALVPFGLGMWLAHYGFHLLTGVWRIVPVAQSAAMETVGWAVLGEPRWQWSGMRPGSVFPIEVGFVILGTLGSLGLAYLISERDRPRRPVLATLPWAAAIAVMAAAALWILSQPMAMRGMGMGMMDMGLGMGG